LKVLKGADSYNVEVPLTLGHEVSGWIAELGENVTGWETDQAVVVSCLGGCGICPQCAGGFTQYCATPVTPGITYDGGLAPYMVAKADQLVALGDLSVAEAAPLADAGMTTYHAVTLCEDVLGNKDSLVIIGFGGLGALAVQIAKANGWQHIIVADVMDHKRHSAMAFGASDFLLSTPQLADDVRALVGSNGTSAVIDLVGIDATLQAAADMVRPGGRIVQVGTGGGSVPFGRAHIKPGVSLVQSRGGNIQDLQAVVAMRARGELRTAIDPIALHEVTEAYQRLANGKLTKRAVVVFDHRNGSSS
jgi:propanol-preferring alcohol dehydrogenase